MEFAAQTNEAIQRRSAGDSTPEIHAAALAAADPQPGLRWLDVGIGKGDIAREILNEWSPKSVIGLDLLDWLAPDLADSVELHLGDAHTILTRLPPADRVLFVETIEHVDAPWLTLRFAARAVAPGGRIVVTTPNLRTLRSRCELLVRGSLTSFRPNQLEHLTPAVPHVMESILHQEGLIDVRTTFAGRDIIPMSGGRMWGPRLAAARPDLLNVSVQLSATRPEATEGQASA